MMIKQVRFITSLTGLQPFEGEGLPQVAVCGKSNVGKSSLINCLSNNFKLARTSQAPGKTRLINIFLVNGAFHLVDLPGYGYAKVSKETQANWGQMMDRFLSQSPYLKHMLHLVDVRHQPTALDEQMAAWIQHNQVACTVVATKADKLSRAQRQKAVQSICRSLGVQPWEVIPFSCVTREGKEEVLARLDAALEDGE